MDHTQGAGRTQRYDWSIDPLHMTSHSQKGGRLLDSSCALCVKTCAWPQRACCVSRYARGSYWFLTQYRTRLRTIRVFLGVNSLLCKFVHDFDTQNDIQYRHTWLRFAYCKFGYPECGNGISWWTNPGLILHRGNEGDCLHCPRVIALVPLPTRKCLGAFSSLSTLRWVLG